MKYSIDDRVIVKESGEKGIVVQLGCGAFPFAVYREGNKVNWYSEQTLLTDLTAIEKPFGLLSREVQEELKAVDNGGSIQWFADDVWLNCKPAFDAQITYRLSPTYKQEEVKEMTVGEIEAKLGHKVKVVKGE